MSELLNTDLKRQACGGLHHVANMLRDALGGILNLQVVGTDPDVAQPIDGSALTEDYSPDGSHKNPDGTFLICIESDDGVYQVTLADGTMFTITAVQSSAYVGQWYPGKILSVNVGSTGLFSVGY